MKRLLCLAVATALTLAATATLGSAQAGDKGDNQPQTPQPKDNVANSKKQVQDAEYKMKQAEEKIARKDNKDASDDQGKAIQDLEKAKKNLEDLLRQLREEELERLLAALQGRCEKMLAMQIQVQIGTESVFKVVDAQADKKPTRQNQTREEQNGRCEQGIVCSGYRGSRTPDHSPDRHSTL